MLRPKVTVKLDHIILCRLVSLKIPAAILFKLYTINLGVRGLWQFELLNFE